MSAKDNAALENSAHDNNFYDNSTRKLELNEQPNIHTENTKQTRQLSFARNLSLILTFLTGAAGLIYEVAWHRYLANFIGSEARAAAIILAVFLGGLCVGYALFGSLSRGKGPRTLVRWCGLVELGIGAWALLFPWLYGVLWRANGVVPYNHPLGLLLDILLCALFIGVPTVLMGGTLPLLTQGLSRSLAESSRFHALVYAVNTAGAFAGCLIAGFILLPRLGLKNTVLITSALNFVAGALLVFASTLVGSSVLEERVSSTALDAEGRADGTQQLSVNQGMFLAFLAGFYALSLQVVFIRLVGLSMGSSEYAFSMVVSVYVLMLALGSWRLAGGGKTPLVLNQLLVGLGLVVVYLSVPYWPYASHVLRSMLTSVEPNFYVYHLLCFVALASVVGLAIAPMGSTLPLLFGATRARTGSLGSVVGRLYALNTFGCAAGALCGGYGAMYYIDLHQVYRACLLLVLVSTAGALVWSFRRQPVAGLSDFGPQSSVVLSAVLALEVVALMLLPSWDQLNFAAGTFRTRQATDQTFRGAAPFYTALQRGRKLLTYKDDPNSTVAVIERELDEDAPHPIFRSTESGRRIARSVWVNGKSDGTTQADDLRTMRLSGQLPALLQTSKSDLAAVVGFGTGVTVGSLTLHENLHRIDCIEISPFVRKFSPYFDFANHGASSHHKVSWHTGDAYRFLGSSKDSYAVVMSEPSNPWVTGVERLYAREFYLLVRDHLAPGGVYAQWFHTYNIRRDTLLLVLRTFTSVFQHVRVFDLTKDLILIGSNEPLGAESVSALRARISTPAISAELAELDLSSLEGILGLERIVPPELYTKSPLHSLEFPRLAFKAGVDFFFPSSFRLNEMLEEADVTAGPKPLRLVDLALPP